MIFFQTRSVDLTIVNSSVKATIASLDKLRGGQGEHFKGLEQYIEGMDGSRFKYSEGERDKFLRNVSTDTFCFMGIMILKYVEEGKVNLIYL
jgi:hypothetical protein